MELEQLEQFVVLAEMLNFGRAAARLEIGQPVLSRSMQKLEKSLGVSLVDRSNKRIALTAAGMAFAEEARETLARAGLARDIARRAHAGDIGTIRIGLVPTALYHGFYRGVRKFRSDWPGIKLILQSDFVDAQIAALRGGRLDLGFFHLNMPPVGPDDMSFRVIDRAYHLAAIPSAWPQARKKKLRLAELAKCPFVFSAVDSTGIHQALYGACLAAGFSPRIVQEVQGAAMLHAMVACEVGVAFINRRSILPEVSGISFVPIVDMPKHVYVDFVMAWITRGVTRPLASLIQCVEDAHKMQSARRDAGD